MEGLHMKSHVTVLFIAFTISFILGFISCTSDSTGPEGLGQHGVTFAIAFVDSTGQDLLDKETSNYWTEDDLDIYYLKDGEKELVFNANLDMPKNFWIYDPDNYKGVEDSNCHMELLLSSYLDEDGYSTTYIEFPGGEMDTLRLKGRLTQAGFFGDTLWYNGEFMWEAVPDGEGPSEPRYLTIEKVNAK